jgi:hypothetical protein
VASRLGGDDAGANRGATGDDSSVCRGAYGLAARVCGLKAGASWSGLGELPRSDTPRPMEGHAATLLADRWLVLVGGFGRGIDNEVITMDT